MGLLFRFLSALLLAIAIMIAVIDSSRSIAANALELSPFADVLILMRVDLQALIDLGETSGLPALSALIEALLSAPGILVFTGLALIFYAIGYRRRREPRHALHA